MTARFDLTGQRFGRLVAVQTVSSSKGHIRWLCQCDCGREVSAFTDNLRRGHTRSCGCLQRELAVERNLIHGQSFRGGGASRLYTTWAGMKGRCDNPANGTYEYYGGRGIRVCAEWADFLAFERWALTHGYADSLSIDRIDNNGDYEPANCRWTDRKTQQRNTSRNSVFLYRSKPTCLAELAEISGINRRTIRERIRRGWSVESAVERKVLT